MTNEINTQTNYEISKLNSLKHGILSKYAVMPWEDAGEYEALLQSLIGEYAPQGVTEEHLIEELAGVMWRKKRLRYAEQTILQARLSRHIHCYEGSNNSHSAVKSALLEEGKQVGGFDIHEAVTATPEETGESIKAYKGYIKGCRKALSILETSSNYEKALKSLNEEERKDWLEWIGEPVYEYSKAVYEATPESLATWITGTVEHYEKRLYELENRDKITYQLYGQVCQPDMRCVESYSRYETHLDRKLERILSTFFRLREIKSLK